MYPTDKKYSKEHEWVKIEGDLAIIGITDYAQNELGEIVYVELPQAGSTFQVQEVFGSVESVKAVSDIFAPISGEIDSPNELLEEEPELLNNDPHGEGWLVKMVPANTAEIDELMDAAAYEKFLAEEGSK
ncbi:glycine cleavage system protein GcvH [candidate division CSSED10-310 bacterium]|uniref:Glycine cleavage system H protein n=1 Tax=candidate division CSSED10-310 bacterium TaxID=2855610 RepID=A0ABV6Z2Q3_UNCC1